MSGAIDAATKMTLAVLSRADAAKRAAVRARTAVGMAYHTAVRDAVARVAKNVGNTWEGQWMAKEVLRRDMLVKELARVHRLNQSSEVDTIRQLMRLTRERQPKVVARHIRDLTTVVSFAEGRNWERYRQLAEQRKAKLAAS